MAEPIDSGNDWNATWEGVRKQNRESTLAASPSQRLAWLEEVLELVHRAGALRRTPGSKGTP